MPTSKTQPHKTPTQMLGEAHLALATRTAQTRMVKATVTNANAKAHNHVSVEVSDPDPEWVQATVTAMTQALRAEFPPPVENGAQP